MMWWLLRNGGSNQFTVSLAAHPPRNYSSVHPEKEFLGDAAGGFQPNSRRFRCWCLQHTSSSQEVQRPSYQGLMRPTEDCQGTQGRHVSSRVRDPFHCRYQVHNNLHTPICLIIHWSLCGEKRFCHFVKLTFSPEEIIDLNGGSTHQDSIAISCLELNIKLWPNKSIWILDHPFRKGNLEGYMILSNLFFRHSKTHLRHPWC